MQDAPQTHSPRSTLDEIALRKLAALERRHLRRSLESTGRESAVAVARGGRHLVSFSCNDYLGLTHHPDVIAASIEATRRYGVGAGAARLVTGNHPLYEELEQRLAALKGTEDAVVFGSGYLTNVGVVPIFASDGDLIVMDELSHSCMLTGAELSGARLEKFRHNDVAHARELLERHRSAHRHCLLLTEGVFSMEGDLGELPALAELAERYDAWLMTDDAHGLGVIGGGRGSTFAFDTPVSVPLQMGTLSKAVGAYGGYLCASHPVVELVRNRARSFVYSTGLPPGVVAAACKSLELIATDATLVGKPLRHARAFCAAVGLPPAQSPIVAWLVGSAERALETSARLRDAGFLVAAIRPPTVPPGTARLRFTFSAAHTEEEVEALVRAVRPLLSA